MRVFSEGPTVLCFARRNSYLKYAVNRFQLALKKPVFHLVNSRLWRYLNPLVVVFSAFWSGHERATNFSLLLGTGHSSEQRNRFVKTPHLLRSAENDRVKILVHLMALNELAASKQSNQCSVMNTNILVWNRVVFTIKNARICILPQSVMQNKRTGFHLYDPNVPG